MPALTATLTITDIGMSEDDSAETLTLTGQLQDAPQRFAPEVSVTLLIRNPAVSDTFAVGDTVTLTLSRD